MKATEQYFPVVLFIILYQVVLTLRRFMKGETLGLPSSNDIFQREGTQKIFIRRALLEVTLEDWNLALQQKQREQKRILPFVTKYHPAVPNLKSVLMNNWLFIRQ